MGDLAVRNITGFMASANATSNLFALAQSNLTPADVKAEVLRKAKPYLEEYKQAQRNTFNYLKGITDDEKRRNKYIEREQAKIQRQYDLGWTDDEEYKAQLAYLKKQVLAGNDVYEMMTPEEKEIWLAKSRVETGKKDALYRQMEMALRPYGYTVTEPTDEERLANPEKYRTAQKNYDFVEKNAWFFVNGTIGVANREVQKEFGIIYDKPYNYPGPA